MANLFDYLQWRGDIPLREDPFAEVDNLVLAELAYTRFQEIVPGDGRRVSLQEAHDAFFSRHTREEILAAKSFTARAPLLMPDMLSGKRFRDLELCCYVDEVDKEQDLQMSAIAFLLPDGTAYLAFRGTDGTLVGWKEDFNFSFQPETEGQRRAVAWLNRVGASLPGPLRVGGHSKGGNFATYASAFCERSIQDRILQVYSNDGPGFRQEVTEKEGYLRILDRVFSIIPDTSVIGLMFSGKVRHHVVSSSASGILQHDALTWNVRRNRFVPAQLSETGKAIQNIVSGLMDQVDDGTRKYLIDTVFGLLSATGQDSFSGISEQKWKSVESMINAGLGMPLEKSQEVLRVLGQLGQTGSQAAADYIAKLKQTFSKEK